jgi:hypothetical protein
MTAGDAAPAAGKRIPFRVRIPQPTLAAALIMSAMLILSSFVTTLLIAPADYQPPGKASGRAIAFLAHAYLGRGFGTVTTWRRC